MYGFSGGEVEVEGAGLEGGREGVGVEAGARGGLHLRVEEESVEGEVVADEADDDGVPEDGGGAREGVEEVAREVGLALLAEVAEAGADGGGCGLGLGLGLVVGNGKGEG